MLNFYGPQSNIHTFWYPGFFYSPWRSASQTINTLTTQGVWQYFAFCLALYIYMWRLFDWNLFIFLILVYGYDYFKVRWHLSIMFCINFQNTRTNNIRSYRFAMQTIKWKVGPILCCRRCIGVSFEVNLPLHKMNIYEHKFPKSP